MDRLAAGLVVYATLVVCTAASRQVVVVPPEVADHWSHRYRNWSYYPDYVMPPLGPNNFTDCAQVWQLPGDEPDQFRMTFLVYDGIGYQTHMALSTDLLSWNHTGVIYSPRANAPPLSWNATPGQFDYGGATFIGPLLADYNISSGRTLRKSNGKYWFSYFGQPVRNQLEPPPGATGMASSVDGLHWERAATEPLLSVQDAARGKWEATQIYAPYLLKTDGDECSIYYNANSGTSELQGVAWCAF